MPEKNKPDEDFEIGSIKATIWKKPGKGKLPLYSVEFSKTHKDGDEFKDTKYFNHEDLLNLAKVAERAEHFISFEKGRIKAASKK